jgi:PAS domain S-box-containing protein
LSGEFEQVKDWAAIVLQEAKTVLETVKVYEVKIQIDMAQNQPLKAINTSLQVLQQLGISFPRSPAELDVRLELDTITSLLGEKPIRDLLHLPKMTDPDKLAALRILSSLTAAAHIAAPNLLPLLASKQVNLSIQYGNASVSPFAYATFGSILCGIVKDIELGCEFGQLALELLSQLNAHSIRARTLLFTNFFIIHRKKHARELQQSFLEVYQSALEIGDLEFAAYSAHAYCRYCWAIGKGLVELEHEMTTYSEAIRQLKHKGALTWNQIDHQSVLNLMGRSVSPTCLVGEIYNEEQELSQYETANVGNAIFSASFNKLFLCYLFSEYAKAVENSALAERYLIQAISGPFEPLYYLYDSLVKLATHSESNAQVREEVLEKVAISQEKMRLWADHAPMNYLHKYHLVEAEKARVLGQLLEAEKFYEQAIQGARENEYIQEEALAYELAAKHYVARGLEKFAQLYMKEAHYCYERWGALAKVKDLETRYPQFFPQSSGATYTPIHATSGMTSTRFDSAFDLATVLKASQAISSEIELDRLLRSLMQILIENAGAQTGSLILETSGEWKIEATCELNDSENVCTTQVLESMSMANRLPESMIQYVIRTHEPVILNDATDEGNFIHDPYIQHNQPRSLLCLPLLNQSKLVGVLYLENQLTTGAFTPERSQVLNLLSTQAAIAIENAKLYAQLQASKNELTQFFEAVPVGIGVVDATGRPCYSNQRSVQLLGKGIEPAVTPDQFAEVYQIYLAGTDQPYPTEKMPVIRALSGDRTVINDMEIRRNNVATPVEVWGTPVFDEHGNVTYAIATFQDITERKQAEKLLADYNCTLEQQVAERTVALQRSEAKFRTIFENSQVGIYRTRLSDRLLLDANQRFANLYGFDSPEQIIGIEHTADYYVNPSDRQQFLEVLKRDGEVRNFEAQMRKRDGTLFWVLFSSYLNAADGYIEGVVVDISDLKQAEAALHASEAELRALVSAIPDPLFVLTAEGRLVEAVEVKPNQLSRPIEEQIGQTLHQIFEKEQADEFLNHIQQVLRTQQILTVEYSTFLNGREAWFSARIAPISHDQVICLSRDITALKQAEEASILEERNRMAREIHDTLAQAFTGILIQVDAATQVLTDDVEATQAHLDTIEELARTGLAEARRSVTALRPQLLEEGDLSSALEQLVNQMRVATHTDLIYSIQGVAYSLPAEVENNLLRIGQEALTNAIKYANANEIRIELVYDNAQCRLQVKDDGQGFGVVGVPMSGGFGLLGMSERAERIGAQLVLESQPDQGTEIIVIVNRG